MTGLGRHNHCFHTYELLGAHYDVALSQEDMDLVVTALWDLAALHTAFPRRHLDRLHQVRRYLLAVQVYRDADVAWETALPAPTSEST